MRNWLCVCLSPEKNELSVLAFNRFQAACKMSSRFRFFLKATKYLCKWAVMRSFAEYIQSPQFYQSTVQISPILLI